MTKRRSAGRVIAAAAVLAMLAAVLPVLAASPAQAVTSFVINEIHADPASGTPGDANGDGVRNFSDDEFVEIFNDSGTDVDISGWTLADGFGVRHTFPSGTVVPDQCSIVVFGGGTPTGSFGASVVQTASSGALGLNNGGDTVTLDDGTSVVATESYTGAQGGNNQSITRDPDVTGVPWTLHSVATGSGGALWSPGTLIDGSTFSGCSLPALVGVGTATPNLLTAGEAALLTVAVTPGTSPPSTGIAVQADLSAIGGSATQAFFDDGTNGDVTAGDNTFSFATTVGGATAPGAKSLPVSISDNEGRTGSTAISLTVIQVLTIMEIQGSGLFSPFAGDTVETSGVVTAITDNGFDGWIQDPAGDGDPDTSDGIFVDDFPGGVAVGDLITVRGEVEDQQFGDALPRTRLDDTVLVSIDSTGNALPAPVPLVDLEDESLQDGIAFWENLEGMRVSVKQGRVVAPTSRFGEFGMLTKKDAKPGSGYEPSVKQILLRSTGPNAVDYNPERILVDDATLPDAIQVRPGDVVKGFVGVVDYTFGAYKLQPTSIDEIETEALPTVPASKRSGPDGNATITSYNVENLFDLVVNTPTVIDSIGRIGEDPGSEWSGGGIGTQNETLRRMATVCAGDSDPSDAFDPSVEWDGFAQDTFGGLGSHSVTCGTASGLFFSEYVEGSSNNKALEIYNGTGAAVNLGALNVTVQIFFNGSTSAGQTIGLSGTLADGDVYVVANPSAAPAILAVADQTGNVFYNGNDAVTLNIGGKDDAGSTPSASELETQLTKLAAAIQAELELPEIMVLQEVENTAIAQELGDRVNAAAGTDYVAVSFETSDGRGIEVAFLYDDDRVDLLDAFQLSGPDVEAAFGPSSASPGREPLYGEFLVNGEVVHIVGNHFKSKGGDDPPFGVDSSLGLPFDRITEVQRKLQAEVVADFVEVLLTDDPDALVMITGDLNDFQFGEPGEGADHPVAILENADGGFTNLIELEKEPERWTFIFDGNSQVLDHMLVNDALLAKLAAIDILHFNAGYPAALSSDPTTTIRASDHDAVEGRFNLG